MSLATHIPVWPLAAQLLEVQELAGYRDLWEAAPPEFALAHGVAYTSVGGASCTRVASQPGVRFLNQASGLAGGVRPRLGQIAAIEDFFTIAGAPALITAPDDSALARWLAAHGWSRDFGWMKFARDTRVALEPVDCPLAILPVTAVDAERAAAIVADGFGLPGEFVEWMARIVGRHGWHVLGAYDGDELVATASLYEHAAGGWCTWAATHPGYRGLGAQKALLRARIELARDLGIGTVVAETGERVEGRPDASYRNILRAGFREMYVRGFWRRSVPA